MKYDAPPDYPGYLSGSLEPAAAGRDEFLACTPLIASFGDGRPLYLRPEGIDLSRFNARAPVLLDHVQGVESVVGVILSAWIHVDCLFVVLRFAKRGRGAEVEALVRDGLLSHTSLGFVHSPPDGSGFVPYSVPRELSVVAVPRIFGSRVLGRACPVMLSKRAKDVAAGAVGNRQTWESFAMRRAGMVADALGVTIDRVELALDAAVRVELAQHQAESEGLARRAFGLEVAAAACGGEPDKEGVIP